MKRKWKVFLLLLALLALTAGACSRSASLAEGQNAPIEVAQVEVPLDDVVRPDADSKAAAQSVNIEPVEVVRSEPEPAVARTPAPDPKQAPKKDGEEEEDLKRDYSEFFKDPKKLGFSPGEHLFRNVYYHIKTSFVEEVEDKVLFEGVKAEVANLLEQAKVPTDGLKKLDSSKKVLPQLLSLYGDKVDKNLLVYSAILGMLQGLDDNYSVLMTPNDYGKLQEQMQAKEFGGIGIYIELDRENGNQLTVFEPIEGTPAYNAGLEAGDKILKIDGEDTKGITLDMAQAAIRGPEGSKVVLTIQRESGQKNFSIERGRIHVVSVSGKMLPNNIGYIRLRLFGQETSDELEQAMDKLRDQGARALILDLRNNGGGYIDASVGVVGNFIENDGLVVYTVDRNERRREYRSPTLGTAKLPMIVLINKFSASASEITAGALRDHKVATLVGEHSFGKGSVQQLYPFPDGSALKLTIAKFYTPGGNIIDKKGIEPDFKLEMEPRFVGRGEKDTQLKKAVEILESKLTSHASL
ncbi:MAG: S41 family peptidase [Armatimonadetes bacterium]|nr:S41 family peptidase [Armatimonadota bacterium]